MIDAQALADAKARLIAGWDRAPPEDTSGEGMARFESLAPPRRPRGGLAVGHSVNPATGEPQLELRVTAAAGPNYEQARKLAAQAEADGLRAILRSVKNAIAPAASPGAPTIAGRRRPLHMGASIAHIKSHAGTLGGFVKLEDGGIGVVSCGHVLARLGKKWGEPKDPVHQPGMPDQSPVVARNRVGQLTDIFAPFIEAQTDNLDVAVARLDDGQQHIGNVIPDLDFVPADLKNRPIGKPLPDGGLPIGTRVVKIGRSTGVTEAIVSALDFRNLQVNFGTGWSSERFTFSGVYELLWNAGQPYAMGGDSGSLVMTREGLQPIGLHFASLEGRDGANYSYVVPWPRIKTTFELELI